MGNHWLNQVMFFFSIFEHVPIQMALTLPLTVSCSNALFVAGIIKRTNRSGFYRMLVLDVIMYTPFSSLSEFCWFEAWGYLDFYCDENVILL